MKKLFVLAIALLALSVPTFAGVYTYDFASGDETGWTRWAAPWGAANYEVSWNGPTAAEGTLYLNPGQSGSFGWWTVVAVAAGTQCSVEADWTGNIKSAGWAEVMLYTSNSATTDWGNLADVGAAGNIAYKKDSWGMNNPTTWGWQKASLSKHPSGNNGSIFSAGYVCIALKLGGGAGEAISGSWDNVTLTTVPEPTSLLALVSGIGALGLIRRRK